MSWNSPGYATKIGGMGSGAGTPVPPPISVSGLYSEPLVDEDGNLMLSENNDVIMGLYLCANPLNIGGSAGFYTSNCGG
jgi:hypothetical protein